MKKDEARIEQEEEEEGEGEEEEEEKPQAHILLMRAQTDMLIHTQTNAVCKHRVWGCFVPPLQSHFTCHLSLMWFYDTHRNTHTDAAG